MTQNNLISSAQVDSKSHSSFLHLHLVLPVNMELSNDVSDDDDQGQGDGDGPEDPGFAGHGPAVGFLVVEEGHAEEGLENSSVLCKGIEIRSYNVGKKYGMGWKKTYRDESCGQEDQGDEGDETHGGTVFLRGVTEFDGGAGVFLCDEVESLILNFM